MRNKIVTFLAACLCMAVPALAQNYNTYTAQQGVTLATAQAATATYVSPAIRLPNFSGAGTLTIVETGVTGSPSGCTAKLAYQPNNVTTAGSTVSTTSFTPATGTQVFTIAPTQASGDNYVLTYACSSTYPTAGLLNVTFSPIPQNFLTNVVGSTDPCQNAGVLKSSAAISISGAAGTYQIVALAAGKAIYVCGISDGSAGTTPSVELLPGTGTNCGTPGTALTGAIPFTSGSVIRLEAGGATVATAPAGDELCLVTVGTGHYGVVTYVQQ